MTFEQKVEKLRGIADVGTTIWCKTSKEDNELSELANLFIDEEEDKYDCDCTLSKTKYLIALEFGEIKVEYLGFDLEKGIVFHTQNFLQMLKLKLINHLEVGR